ncbi:elongation factor P [Patescibacteria group bacterium]|nr:elongation factor P [Patescibacteria group bacterium]MBU4512189.1 elongation factor P [Patescibacteria group bacterium]MCG2693461.1 elongation factor P [Candidatus Parcubacteria bacterium]
MLTINDLKIGTEIQIDDEPYAVLKSEHKHMGRGGASVRVKIRSLISGKVLEKTYKQGDKVETAELKRSKANFLYNQGDEYHFMNEETYDQFFLTKEQLGTEAGLLKEGQNVDVLDFKNTPVSIFLPAKVELKVTQAPPGIRGDTAQGSVTKTITLETGMQIQVPLFVKEGDVLRINTETGEYVERM